jgi:hypothetical protein
MPRCSRHSPTRIPHLIVIVWSRIRNNKSVTAASDHLELTRRSRSFQALHAWAGRNLSRYSIGLPDAIWHTPTYLLQVQIDIAKTDFFRVQVIFGVVACERSAYFLGSGMSMDTRWRYLS